MPKPILHVMFGPSAAGTLRQALSIKGRAEEVVCPFDDFSFGPIAADDETRSRWVEDLLDVADWQNIVSDNAPFLATSLSPNITPVVWISRRCAESYAGFLWWLSHLDDAPCWIVDGSEHRITNGFAATLGMLNRDAMAGLLDTQMLLEAADRQRYRSLWKRLEAEDAPFRVIDPNGVLASAPLTYFDPLLLRCVSPEWQKMAYIIGESLWTSWEDGVHQVGDLVLYSRLCTLAERGDLEWRGDLSSMHGCELRLVRDKE